MTTGELQGLVCGWNTPSANIFSSSWLIIYCNGRVLWAVPLFNRCRVFKLDLMFYERCNSFNFVETLQLCCYKFFCLGSLMLLHQCSPILTLMKALGCVLLLSRTGLLVMLARSVARFPALNTGRPYWTRLLFRTRNRTSFFDWGI